MSIQRKTTENGRSARRDGFTLLELVVATSVLLVLTVLIGSLFRQASSSWDTGRVRGEGGMIARGVVGAISRDLATAIDGRPWGGCLPTASGSTLRFCCLKPGDGDGHEVHEITYSVSSGEVTRRDENLTGSGSSTSHVFKKRTGQKFSIKADDVFERVGPAPGTRDYEDSGFEAGWDAPAGIKIRLTFSQEGSFSGVAVRSLGKNGRADEDGAKDNDDIVVR